MEYNKLILPFMFFGLLILILVIIYLKMKHKERMTMIQKGMDPSDNESLIHQRHSLLSKGVFLIALGIGLLIAQLLALNFSIFDNFSSYVAVLMFCGGVGLLVYLRFMNRVSGG
jgi:fucose 4-O-acetylase-like acetyltransferase